MGLGPLPQVRRGTYKNQAPETYSDFLDLNLRWVEPGDLHFNISQLFLGSKVKATALDPWRMGSEPGLGVGQGTMSVTVMEVESGRAIMGAERSGWGTDRC